MFASIDGAISSVIKIYRQLSWSDPSLPLLSALVQSISLSVSLIRKLVKHLRLRH